MCRHEVNEEIHSPEGEHSKNRFVADLREYVIAKEGPRNSSVVIMSICK